MRVDQQPRAERVAILGVAGQMHFADVAHRKSVEISARVAAVIDAAHHHVVDVEQQPAAAAPRDLRDEIHFVHLARREGDIGRGILQQQAALEPALRLIDMRDHAVERRAVVGDGQQIVEIDALMRGPRQMLGEQRRLVARDQRVERVEMGGIERPLAADRQADAMDRERIDRAQRGERGVGRPAGAEIVFGMDFEKAERRPFGDQTRAVLGLETDARADRRRRGAAAAGVVAKRRHRFSPVLRNGARITSP